MLHNTFCTIPKINSNAVLRNRNFLNLLSFPANENSTVRSQPRNNFGHQLRARLAVGLWARPTCRVCPLLHLAAYTLVVRGVRCSVLY